jgi:hypothetical protein
MWCGVISDQIPGPYIFPQGLIGDIYANLLQHKLPALFKKVPLWTWCQVSYQYDGNPTHFRQIVMQCLKQQFFGQVGEPQWSMDLTLLG